MRSFGCRNQNESESIQTVIEGLEVGNASKCAFVHPRKACRVSGVAGRCEEKWRGGALKTYVSISFWLGDAARSREFREFPSIPYICASALVLLFNCLGVFVANWFCSLALGRSVVGRVLRYVRTQKDPFFQNGSRTGPPQVRGHAMRRRRAARNAISTTIMHIKVFLSRACRQMRRRRPL